LRVINKAADSKLCMGFCRTLGLVCSQCQSTLAECIAVLSVVH
jgi:hypothetical protein